MVSYKALNTTVECLSFYLCYIFWNSNRGQGMALLKCAFPDPGYTIWNRDRVQVMTVIEFIIS